MPIREQLQLERVGRDVIAALPVPLGADAEVRFRTSDAGSTISGVVIEFLLQGGEIQLAVPNSSALWLVSSFMRREMPCAVRPLEEEELLELGLLAALTVSKLRRRYPALFLKSLARAEIRTRHTLRAILRGSSVDFGFKLERMLKRELGERARFHLSKAGRILLARIPIPVELQFRARTATLCSLEQLSAGDRWALSVNGKLPGQVVLQTGRLFEVDYQLKGSSR